MKERDPTDSIIRAGDRDGLGIIYSTSGGLISGPEEQVLSTLDGWEMEVASPWRRLLPNIIFTGFGGDVTSKLYITSARIVLIRKIDIWREVKGELTPLGIPNAAAREMELRNLQALGAREYCSIKPGQLHVVKSKKFNRPRSLLDLHLVGTDSKQYAVSVWKPKGVDEDALALIESRFPRATR